MTTYRTHGNGTGLVLVHGAGPGSVTWDALVDRFTDRHTVILPDLSGSDPVPDPGDDLTLEGLTNELAAVIEDRDAGPADIVGHSLGAVVRPELVRRLVPVAGFAHAAQDAYVRTVMRIWRDLVDDAETFSRFAMLVAFSSPYLNGLSSSYAELDSGHVMRAERPEEFVMLVRDFLG
ncbi:MULTISPECIES: alpha/beta hydrolase [unclassified Streptomyces]|uniref:alpha/beta fold hydrolase n=1 Tax=unclassified Streptomyces TaxID=2593676 RepID=UPI000DB9410E|nr:MULTISPECIES: alpha/beta hydrolase [unclassified Streptomyces]MYT75742.1 alpha/beta fold hydrolase [Streptomyces sp. SID8367]RAJ87151.1 alpha/beta hydrolase family protein [Streptomyces sp. PsTaAH-137]